MIDYKRVSWTCGCSEKWDNGNHTVKACKTHDKEYMLNGGLLTPKRKEKIK